MKTIVFATLLVVALAQVNTHRFDFQSDQFLINYVTHLQVSIARADDPLTEDELVSPILKGAVRDLLATALPDCLNQKVVAQIAELFRNIDKTVQSINGNLPKIGMSDLLDNLNAIRTGVQKILNDTAVDISAAPKQDLSCDADIPSNVQKKIDQLITQATQLQGILSAVDSDLTEVAALNEPATSTRRIGTVQTLLIIVKMVSSIISISYTQ